MVKITGKSIIGKVVIQHPKTAEVFHKYGWGCLGCALAGSETIERGAIAHGLDKVKLKEMLAELNKVAGTSKKK